MGNTWLSHHDSSHKEWLTGLLLPPLFFLFFIGLSTTTANSMATTAAAPHLPTTSFCPMWRLFMIIWITLLPIITRGVVFLLNFWLICNVQGASGKFPYGSSCPNGNIRIFA